MNQWAMGITMLFCMIIAMLLDMLGPAWGTLHWLAPSWIFIFLLFFTVYYPQMFNVGLAWLFGLLVDIWLGQPLGQNALLFVCAVFLIHVSFNGLEHMQLFGKLTFIVILLFFYEIVPVIVADHSTGLWSVWLLNAVGGALSGALIWCLLAMRMEKRRT